MRLRKIGEVDLILTRATGGRALPVLEREFGLVEKTRGIWPAALFHSPCCIRCEGMVQNVAANAAPRALATGQFRRQPACAGTEASANTTSVGRYLLPTSRPAVSGWTAGILDIDDIDSHVSRHGENNPDFPLAEHAGTHARRQTDADYAFPGFAFRRIWVVRKTRKQCAIYTIVFIPNSSIYLPGTAPSCAAQSRRRSFSSAVLIPTCQ